MTKFWERKTHWSEQIVNMIVKMIWLKMFLNSLSFKWKKSGFEYLNLLGKNEEKKKKNVVT
jgi:hypothetical protein